MALNLPPEKIAFIESGVSIYAASRDKRLLPSVCRVLGCKVITESNNFKIWLSKTDGEQLLRDCHSSDQIAVVFSAPLSHQTWQVKGQDIQPCPVENADLELIDKHVSAFAKVLVTIGYPPPFTTALYPYTQEELVALRFQPSHIYEQTPGPNAGTDLPLNDGTASQ